jgi:hypothetical protein
MKIPDLINYPTNWNWWGHDEKRKIIQIKNLMTCNIQEEGLCILLLRAFAGLR